MKKFFALVLALVMALSLTTVAWGVSTYTANDETTLATAVSSAVAGDTIKLGADITIADGITVVPGVIIDGAGNTLTVTGEGGMAVDTTEAAIFSTGAISVKNLTIVGGSRGIYINGTLATDIVIDNVEIVNSCRAINVTSSGANAAMTISNSTLAGKISYQENVTPVTFENCEFVINASVKGNVVEPYSATSFDNCVFEDTFVLSLDDFNSAGANATVELENCVYAGEPVTAANVDDLFTNVGAFDLATVAPATYTATTTPVDTKDAKTMAVKGAMVIEMVPAKDAYVATATGNWVPGYVKHYVDEYGTTYVPCTADVEGALYLYYKGTKSVYDVVVAANPVYVAAATEFTNFGTACGQYDNRGAVAGTKYYTVVDGNGVKALYQGTATTANQVMVDGKLVGIVPTNLINALNDHKWVVEKNAKNEITAAKCSLCGQSASWTLNMASIPTGAEFEAAPGGGYLYWNAAPVATTPSTDKVTSAETFDAGIAMYVGMSVMAAAGSVVVLKKRED